MPTYPFVQIDAFTDHPLGGNPCAVVFDTDEMSEVTMLAVAREMNLSETAFVRRSSVADFGVRYFTPAEEIPLAGHPTIATAFALVHTGRLKLAQDHTTIHLELMHGPIAVEIVRQGKQVERIVMTQRKPQFLSLHDPADVLPAFGLGPEDALPGAPIPPGCREIRGAAEGFRLLQPAPVRAGRGYPGRPDLRPPLQPPARCAGGPVHRLRNRWDGGLPVALRPDRHAFLHG